MQFFDSPRFMASSFPSLVNNLSEGIHTVKCKYGHDDKKCETCKIKYRYCVCVLEYTNVKDDLLEYKCLCCNKRYQRKFDQKLKEQFFNTHKFSNHDNLFYCCKKVFILMNIWMIGKNSIKLYYLKKKILIVT